MLLILLIFPTTNAFLRQHKIGALQLTEQAAKERNVKVRILMPLLDSLTEHTVRNLREEKKQQQPFLASKIRGSSNRSRHRETSFHL